jgi:hypothetical protein
MVLAAGAMILPAAALAQNTAQPAPPTTNSTTPATDAVGPRELQNFSLPGTKTRPADDTPTATVAPATPRSQAEAPPTTTTQRAPARTQRTATGRTATTAPTTAAPTPAAPAPVTATPSPSPTQSLTTAPTSDPFAGAPQPAASAPPAPPPLTTDGSKLWLLPWLAAAIALIAGIALLAWQRSRSRLSYAGGRQVDAFVAPEPAPRPAPPRPAPRAAASVSPPPAPAPESPATEPSAFTWRPSPPPQPAVPSGIVASRLRPTIDLMMRPLRCTIDDAQVKIDFEIELHNGGTAPARAVLAEAKLINAGATQDQELDAFFARPTASGEGIDAIPPMRSMTFTSQVVAPRAALQEYELAGRKAFVPIVAFNAVYEWSGSKGQTSAAFLVGRDTGGEKLGPLRADDGPQEVTRLSTLALPNRLAA